MVDVLYASRKKKLNHKENNIKRILHLNVFCFRLFGFNVRKQHQQRQIYLRSISVGTGGERSLKYSESKYNLLSLQKKKKHEKKSFCNILLFFGKTQKTRIFPKR